MQEFQPTRTMLEAKTRRIDELVIENVKYKNFTHSVMRYFGEKVDDTFWIRKDIQRRYDEIFKGKRGKEMLCLKCNAERRHLKFDQFSNNTGIIAKTATCTKCGHKWSLMEGETDE